MDDVNLFEEQSINEIVDLVKHGDTEAYSFLIKAFQKKIYLYCYYLLGNQEEAEDAAQDTFISGFNQIGQFFPTVSFAAWLYKIAHHRCMDVLKKKNRRFHLFKKYQQELTVSDQPSDRYSDYIHELLSSLNAEERRILLLRALEEYSFEEMSAILDIKPATLRKKYERLRKRLIKGKGGFHYEHAYKTNG